MLQGEKLVGYPQGYQYKIFSPRRKRGAKLTTHSTVVSIEELI